MSLRRVGFVALISVVLAVVALAADVSGKWTSDINTPMGMIKYSYDFQVDGTTLTGTAASEFGSTKITDGKISGEDITFVEPLNFDGQEIRIVYKCKLAGEEIKCTRDVAGFDTSEIVIKRAQ